MNVGELQELLTKYPNDMEVLYKAWSDYNLLNPEDLTTVTGVDIPGSYVMRSHPTMSEQNKSKEKTYLLFPGN